MEMVNIDKAKVKRFQLSDKIKDALSYTLMVGPYFLMFFVFIVLPILIAIILSFTYFDTINTPSFVGFNNYINVFTTDVEFAKYILPNTLKYAFIVGPIGFSLSFFMAWILAQLPSGPRKYLALLLYTPSMVGPILVAILWRSIFSGSENGYLNALLISLDFIDKPIQFLQSPEYLLNIMIFVSLWSSMGIGFLSMLAGILNTNKELYEAGKIDGVRNRFQEIFYITIPSMRPQMLFGSVMAIVGAFSMGDIGVQLSGANPTPQYSGSLIVNHIADYGFLRSDMGYAAALSVILFLIILAFSGLGRVLFAERD
jgi:multiple sugar transport system permease protein